MAKRKKTEAPRPTHFVPDNMQRHFGKEGEAICKNTGPRYFNEELMWYGANTIENTTCQECVRMWQALNKTCRGCGTMITEDTLNNRKGFCSKCDTWKNKKIGIADVDGTGKVVATHGAAKGREAEIEKQLQEQKAVAENAGQSYKGLSAQYNRTQQVQTEEQTMAKKSEKKTPEAKTPKAEKKAPANAEALAKAREASNSKRAEKYALKIKILAKENPKREGSASFSLFKLYKNSMTVGEYVAAGGTLAAVRWDSEHDFIELY